VFTTLHTNDAPSAITRLRDMGLPTFLITATVEGVLAQRLVRKICVSCKTEFTPSAEVSLELGMTSEEAAKKKFFYGKGCDKCNNTGYKGRVGLHELMIGTEAIKRNIQEHARVSEIFTTAIGEGMHTLRMDGMEKVLGGVTDVKQVRAVCVR
jgi:type IV pilus assembly protein PilB